ncbi:hypothetical protein IJT93_02330 [bacterium]|nr:hypothetical protein [bacterium]
MNKFTFLTVISLISLSPALAQAQEPEVSPASETVLTAQSNPWDKYDVEPLPNSSANGPETAQPAADKPSSQTAPASEKTVPVSQNPWDKYEAEPAKKTKETDKKPQSVPPAPALTEEAPLPSDDLPPSLGENPWDKYIPAPSAARRSKKNVAKVKERPVKLELAQPLPQPEIPQGKRFVKNELPVGQNYYFAIEYAGQLVGYSKFKINRLVTLGGESTYVMESASRLKLGIHKIQDLEFTSNAQIDKKTLSPAMFLCAQGSAKKPEGMSVNCIYSEDFIAQSNTYGGHTQGYVEKFSPEDRPLLIFNNLWGHLDTFAEHYWLLVRAAAAGGVVGAYDPILQGTGKIIVYAPIKESWQDKAKNKYTTYLYKITDINSAPLAYVRLNAANYELLEIREIGSGFSFRRSSQGVVSTLDKASGQRIKANSQLSNIYFQDPDKLLRLEAFADLHLRSGELAQHELPNYSQKFYGTIEEGRMNGRFVVTSTLYKQEPKAKYPFDIEVPEELKKYTQASPGIELEVNALKTKALEITWKSETAFQAAQRLNGYIASQISEGLALPSARQTLENKVGNPESKALLLTALLRAIGIPARCIGGLAYRGDSFASHYWVEAWLGPEDGWFQFDPTSNESGFVNASHISLWESGDLQAMDLVVEKFLPRPPRSVDYFKADLKWPIGERRVYSIYQDGRLIGLENAHMYDMEMAAAGENYKFKADAVIMRDKTPLIFESTLTVNDKGLPIAFEAKEDDTEKVYHSDFRFKGNTIIQTLEDAPSPAPKRPEKSQARIAEEQAQAENADSQENASESQDSAVPAPTVIDAETPVSASESASETARNEAQPDGSKAQSDSNSRSESDSADSAPAPETVKLEAQPQAQDETPSEQLGKNMEKAAGETAEDNSEKAESSENSAEESAETSAEESADEQTLAEKNSEQRKQLEEMRACYNEGQAALINIQKENEADNAADSDKPAGKEREIPFSFGTYLIDQRFLSQWAVVVEQSPAVQPEKDETAEPSAAAQAGRVDPNLGTGAVSEEIVPGGAPQQTENKGNSDSKESKENNSDKSGETGAGTFNKTDDAEDDAETYTVQAFIPGTLRTQELTLQRADSDETVTLPDGEEVEAARLDTEKGMIFYVNLETGKVIKISIPGQKLDMYLESVEFKL